MDGVIIIRFPAEYVLKLCRLWINRVRHHVVLVRCNPHCFRPESLRDTAADQVSAGNVADRLNRSLSHSILLMTVWGGQPAIDPVINKVLGKLT